MRISPRRFVLVAAGLLALGAVCGTILGYALILALMLRDGRTIRGGDPGEIFVIAVVFGGSIGAVLTSLLAWVFLRRAPLGRAIGETGLGAVVAGAAAVIVAPAYAIAATVLGFFAAGIRLFVVTRSRARREGLAEITGGAE